MAQSGNAASAHGVAPGRRPGAARLVVLPLLVIALLAGAFYGYRYLREQSLHVATDNALITGALIQVGSLNAGQVGAVVVDVGDAVAEGQVVATVAMPAAIGVSAAGTPRIGYLASTDQQVVVRSPIAGVVVARSANPGDTVAAGQPLVTVIDPGKLWVQAHIEETKIVRLRAGQPVDVTVDTLRRTIPGRVVAVGRATAATFSLIPQGTTAGNFTKVTQLVPVKIAIEYGDLPLVLGGSVGVRIRVGR